MILVAMQVSGSLRPVINEDLLAGPYFFSCAHTGPWWMARPPRVDREAGVVVPRPRVYERARSSRARAVYVRVRIDLQCIGRKALAVSLVHLRTGQ